MRTSASRHDKQDQRSGLNRKARFRRVMHTRGWPTQRALSDAAGIDEGRMSRLLRGSRDLSDEEAKRLAKALKLPKATITGLLPSTSPAI